MTTSGQPPLFETLPPLDKPYLDSSVFIAHIKQEAITARNTTRFEITSRLFEGAEAGQYKLYTSFFTWAEVRRLRESNKELLPEELPTVNALFNQFLENEWLVPIEVDRVVGELAQEIGAMFGLWPGDAIHLASAVAAGCNILLLWDKTTFQDRVPGRTYRGVRLLEPYWEGITEILTGSDRC